MDFLLYLTPIGNEIVNLIASKQYKILENPPICRKHKNIIGFKEDMKFIVCIDNIKNLLSPVEHYVNETVYHEAVHVAQSCKNGPLGVKNPKLSPEKSLDVLGSLKYNPDAYTYEVEAYYLEDKPELVLSYIKKYCF